VTRSHDAMAGRAAIPGGRSLADADAAQRMLLTRSSRSVSADPRESNNEPAGRLGREAERAIRRADSATGKRSTFREKERERERKRERGREGERKKATRRALISQPRSEITRSRLAPPGDDYADNDVDDL